MKSKERTLNDLTQEELLREIKKLKEENYKLRTVYNEAILSEQTFKDLFDSTSDAIYIQDHNGKFLLVNHGAELMYGYPREYFVGKTPEFLSAPGLNDLNEVAKLLQLAINGEEQKFEFWGLRKSGEIFPKTVKMVRGVFQNQKVVVTTAQDITERKIASESVKKSANTLKAIFESSPDGIIIIENNEITLINNRFTEITGLTLRDLKTKTLSSIVDKKDIARFIDKLEEALSKNELLKEIIYRVKLETGEEKTLKNRYSFLGSEKNASNRVVIVSDITEKKKNEDALLQSEFKLKAIFENSVDGIGVSKNGIHIMCNPAFLKIFGYSSFEELKEKPEIMLIAESEREKISSYTLRRNLNEDAPKTYNTTGLRKDGSTFDLEIKVSDYMFEGEKHQVAFVRDITESNKLTNELIKAKNAAEKADKLKSEFLAQISHEIRTPINAILSFASLIKEEVRDKIDDDMSDSFDIMNRAGNRLIRTIDLILSMSELQTDSYDMELNIIDLTSDILENIIREKRKVAQKKNIKINRNFIDDLKINCDENSVYQIFDNLIDNAVKFSEHGEIQVVTKIENNLKTVEVIDSGIGISQEYLEKLFQPFSQEEQGYCRKFDGNGLGLALVKKYCDMNNASISVSSKKGTGTKFTVSFT